MLHCAAAVLLLWCSPHADPLLYGVTAVGEYLLWDICREGLPVLDLIAPTEGPRLKVIRLFGKERGSCSADMPYHQMTPMLTSALGKCELHKIKVGSMCCTMGHCVVQGVPVPASSTGIQGPDRPTAPGLRFLSTEDSPAAY